MEIFEAWPPFLFIAVGLLGLIVGSFLNVVAFRLPRMMERAWREQCAELAIDGSAAAATTAATLPGAEQSSRLDGATATAPGAITERPERFDLWWPPSTCPSCQTRIAPQHNVPVVGFLALGGRCAACKARISPRYPVVEATAALLGLVVAFVFGATWLTVAALGFTWTLLALTLIDLDHTLLPDSLTLPLLWAGVLLAAFPIDATPAADLHSSVIGAVAGYLTLWSVYQLFKLVTGKEGMGYGDFKLLAAIGAWVGWQLLPLVILLSAVVGTVVGGAMIVLGGRSRSTPIPFGPYLAGAGWIALLWGDALVMLYQRILL